MRTHAVLGGATASAGFDQLQLTQSQGAIRNPPKHGNRLGTTAMMQRMTLPLAGDPNGSSIHASDGSFAGPLPLPWWPGREGW